jgi:hypothetical protein
MLPSNGSEGELENFYNYQMIFKYFLWGDYADGGAFFLKEAVDRYQGGDYGRY